MENNDVKNNGKSNGNEQKRRPPSQNGGRPQGASAKNAGRAGSEQANRQGAGKSGNQGGTRQGQGGQSRSTQQGRPHNGAQRQNGQKRGANGAQISNGAKKGQGQAPGQGQGMRPEAGSRPPQKKGEQKNPSRPARVQQPANSQVKNGKKNTAPKGKQRRPGGYGRSEEPIIRRDDYGDGFYTDEVELKRRRQVKEERGARQEEELQKEPMSRRTRKMINIAVCGVIVAVVLITGVVLSLTVLFKTEKIAVEGSTHYTEQQVAQASGLALGENLFLSDKESGGKRVEQALPYVEKAEVGIKIPDTIVIKVTEAKPAYLIAQGDDFVVISTQGRVLERATKNTFDAPIIKGCEITKTKVGETAQIKDKKMLSILNAITQSLQKNKFEGIKEIDVTDAAAISLNYSNRIKIILGTPEDIDYKIRTAMAIISEKLAQTDMGVLDVSSCNSGKKASYYNADSSLYPTEPATEPATQPQTEPATQPATEPYPGEGGQDSSGDDSSSDTNYGADTDGDGIPDDFDGDGIPDYYGDGGIADNDGDGIPDDLDGDGIPG